MLHTAGYHCNGGAADARWQARRGCVVARVDLAAYVLVCCSARTGWQIAKARRHGLHRHAITALPKHSARIVQHAQHPSMRSPSSTARTKTKTPAPAPAVPASTPAPSAPAATTSRDQILLAAAELFMEFGYAATSIDAVAAHLGATKGRIYHHYRSKADLFLDVQVAAMQRQLDAVTPIAHGPGSVLQRLQAMSLRHIQIILTELPMQKVAVQGLERQLLRASATNKRLRAVLKMRDDYENLYAELIDAGMREGVFITLPPRLATKPFFGALNWATLWYSPRRLQSAEAVDEIAQALAAFAVRGLLQPAA